MLVFFRKSCYTFSIYAKNGAASAAITYGAKRRHTMVKITTDSTCDLPRALLEAHNITVAPLGVVKGGKLYQDGINIRTADIAAHVDAGGEITTTNAVNIADYEDLFRRETEKYDAVLHIDIGSGFSCCNQNARLAAEAGKSVGEILPMLEDLAGRLEMSFVLDRLDYMKKGGRCSAVTALGANLLKLHPCIEVIDGKMSVTKKYRGSIEKVVADYVRERLAGRTDIDTSRVIIVDTCEDDSLSSIARKYVEEDGRFGEIIEAKAGCTIFSHCGPGTLGILFARK